MITRTEDLEARVARLEADLARRREAERRAHELVAKSPLFWGGMIVQQPMMFVGRLLSILVLLTHPPEEEDQ